MREPWIETSRTAALERFDYLRHNTESLYRRLQDRSLRYGSPEYNKAFYAWKQSDTAWRELIKELGGAP